MTLGQRFRLALSVVLIALCADRLCAQQAVPASAPRFTLLQYRALMQRDLHQLKAMQGIARADFQSAITEARAAVKQEQEAFGADHPGTPQSRQLLIVALLESGNVEEVLSLLPAESFLAKILQDPDRGRKNQVQFNRFIQLSFQLTFQAAGSGMDFAKVPLAQLEEWNQLARELLILSELPLIPHALAQAKMRSGDLDGAFAAARIAFEACENSNEISDPNFGDSKQISRTFLSLLQQVAARHEQLGHWADSIPLRLEAISVAEIAGESPEPSRRAYERTRLISEMTDDLRRRLGEAELLRDSVWKSVARQQIVEAQTSASQAREIFRDLLGEHSDDFAVMTKVLGFLSWRQAEFRQAVEFMVTAVEILLQTRERDDRFTQEAVSDAVINVMQAAISETSLTPLANRWDAFSQLIQKTYPADHPSAAAVMVANIHLKHLQRLTSEQRQGLQQISPRQRERDRLFQTGSFLQAEEVAAGLWEETSRLLGMDDPVAHLQLFSLANIQTESGKLDLALANYQLLLKISDQRPFHLLPEFSDRFQWMAGSLLRRNQPEPALQMVERGLKAMESSQRRDSASYAFLLQVHARILRNFLSQPGTAISLLENAVEILKETRGVTNLETAHALLELGECELTIGRIAAARDHLDQAMAIRAQFPDQRPQLKAQNLYSLGRVQLQSGELKLAFQSFRQAVGIKERINPQADDLVAVYAHLLLSCMLQNDSKTTDQWLKEFVISRDRAWGAEHLRSATEMVQLARELIGNLQSFSSVPMSKHWEGAIDSLLARAEKVCRSSTESDDGRIAEIRALQGALQMSRGSADRALELLAQAAELAAIAKNVSQDLRSKIVADQSHAAALIGDYSRALALRRQAISGYAAIGPSARIPLAQNLIELGNLLSLTGDLDRAEASLLQAEEIFRLSGRAMGVEYGTTLAEIYLRAGQHDRAEEYLHTVARALTDSMPVQDCVLPLQHAVSFAEIALQRGDFNQVLEISERVGLQKSSPSDAARSLQLQVISSLALMRRGDVSEAQQRLLQVETAVLAPHSRPKELIAMYAAQSELAERLKDDAAALRFSRRAIEMSMQSEAEIGSALSERQQLLSREQARPLVDRYLTLAIEQNTDLDAVYSVVLWWKGGVYLRQRFLKEQMRTADPETRAVAEELQAVNRQLASFAFLEVSRGSETGKKVNALIARQEALESELNGRLPALKSDPSLQFERAAELKKLLPDSVVLLDYLSYVPCPPTGSQSEGNRERLLVFVVQHGEPIHRVDLGMMDELTAEISLWRRSIVQSDARAFQESGKCIRNRIWSPLPGHLSGKTILVSPDGALSQLPLSALPGASPDSYLMEEFPLVIVPVPQELLSTLEMSGNGGPHQSREMLLLGDVNFNSTATEQKLEQADVEKQLLVGGSRAAIEGQMNWQHLPGTQAEVAEIGQAALRQPLGIRLNQLLGADATEAAFRRDAPRAQWLHLATHGFFAQSEVDSSQRESEGTRSLDAAAMGRERIAGFHPGLLSGIVMAGANSALPTDASDGILTALEMASLDLRSVEMAVLSACETGLGELSHGEGVLGLQRAFQIAGCRSVVSSLWKVDDQATRIFMQEFYRNLWEKRLSRLEALRQAQISMMQKYDVVEGGLRGDRRLGRSVGTGKFHGTAPVYWAAFTFSGDWRD